MNALTICPFCGCGCGLVLEVDNNRIHAALPQRSHPVSRGTLCIKGWNSHQFIHHPQRLLHPLIKEKGVFKKASWLKAISFAADGLNRVRDRHGSEAVAVVGSVKCTNEEQYLLSRFCRSVLQTPHMDTVTRLYHSPTIRGLLAQWGFGAATTSLPELEKTDAILIIGACTKTQTANAGSFILQAAKRGSRVLLIDPHEQDHSRFYTLQLKPKPNTDLVLLNAILHIILEKDWQDPNVYLPVGLKENTKKYTADFAARVTGVAAGQIVRLAELFATAKTGVVIYGNGLTQQANAVANVRAVWNLALLTGNVDKAGCGILPLMNSNNMQGSIDMGMATELLPGHAFLTDSASADHFANLWKSSMPKEPGLTLPEMLDHIGDSIRALYVVGENLVRSVPNAAGLDKLDFMIVQELFMTETAQRANVVFPACSFAEKEGTFTNLERRVQRVQAAIPPLGECKPDYEIISLLADKMGAGWTYINAQQIFSEICTVVPMYAKFDYGALQVPGGAIWPVARAGRTYSFAHVESAVPSVELPDTDFPFSLILGRGALHRMTGTLVEHSFTLDKEEIIGIVEVNTDDAKVLKLRSGWNVKIKTRHGEVLRQVVVTRAVSPGTLYAPIHHKDGKTLALAAWAIEPVSKIPQIKVCAARLEIV